MKCLFTIVLSFAFISVAFGQSLIYRAKSETAFDSVQEIAFRTTDFIKQSGGSDSIVVIRVCSNDSIYLALLKSGIKFPSVLEVFEGFGYFDERVLVLKANDCIFENSSITATEIWVKNKNDKLPAYDAKYRSDEISITEVSRSEIRYVGSSKYKKNTMKLVVDLKKESTSKGIIFFPYRKSKTEVNRIKNQVFGLLKRNNIENSRVDLEFVKLDKRRFLYPLKKGTLYPAFYVVKISDKKSK